MNQEGVYGVQYQVSRFADIPWEYIKRQLDEIMLRDVFAPMIGDGLYHVIKADYLKDDVYNLVNPNPDFIRYYAKINHSVAKIQNIVIPVMSEIPITAHEICRWCGNILKLDKRGGCSSCGGWPEGKVW